MASLRSIFLYIQGTQGHKHRISQLLTCTKFKANGIGHYHYYLLLIITCPIINLFLDRSTINFPHQKYWLLLYSYLRFFVNDSVLVSRYSLHLGLIRCIFSAKRGLCWTNCRHPISPFFPINIACNHYPSWMVSIYVSPFEANTHLCSFVCMLYT